ncbi:tripartite tricarboxylate transporter TctB family protein [Desulforhopalus sp. IMCC35007]|uniref:tripartite tricarboxylate transporter TctB family protein n=1 Tax=Desulforhopalus sp. IMCC35007 TaxID=2569543 RepID=UPI0010AEB517|nr:tripartite tricarboxylate transporter TctB family protein [Desulforhopalus sp. IMCC35007]TKB11814.1 tripartite tricarboxylate transporter TctB family protein [Desulforhopalus sp. IMCC35007]
MSERLFVVIMFFGGVVYLYFGLKIEVPFAYEPIGPRAFPVLLGSCLLLLCLVNICIHHTPSFPLKGCVARHGLAVLFYLLTFQLLGFMLATTITTYIIARIVGSSWMEGLLSGLVMAIFFYGIFHFLLGVPLPLGSLFRLGN